LPEYFYRYGTADTLTQEIFNFPTLCQAAVKCKMALTSQQRGWNFIKQTVLWLCSVLSNANLMWICLLTSPFWSGTGIALKEDASVIREKRDIQADRWSRSSCQLGHAGYAPESLARARLSHRCLPSNKRRAHWVCVCVWYHM